MKTCRGCKESKPLSAFGKDPKVRSGRRARCRKCEYAWRYDFTRTDYLKKRYGIDKGDYAAMLERQGGACAICRRVEVPSMTGLHKAGILSVDHCHESGRIRGLLCRRCNAGLAHLGDDPKRIASAVFYMRRILEVPQ